MKCGWLTYAESIMKAIYGKAFRVEAIGTEGVHKGVQKVYTAWTQLCICVYAVCLYVKG